MMSKKKRQERERCRKKDTDEEDVDEVCDVTLYLQMRKESRINHFNTLYTIQVERILS